MKKEINQPTATGSRKVCIQIAQAMDFAMQENRFNPVVSSSSILCDVLNPSVKFKGTLCGK